MFYVSCVCVCLLLCLREYAWLLLACLFGRSLCLRVLIVIVAAVGVFLDFF